VKEVNNQVYYQVPTPNELFMVIQSLNLSYNASLLNSPDNADKYTSKASQALNFGVYSADLALAASFKDATQRLFHILKQLEKWESR
jgi:glutathionyl-hydroquinone reductase